MFTTLQLKTNHFLLIPHHFCMWTYVNPTFCSAHLPFLALDLLPIRLLALGSDQGLPSLSHMQHSTNPMESVSSSIWEFPVVGVPQNRWFISWKIRKIRKMPWKKWMIWRSPLHGGSRLVAFFQLGIFILFLLKETGCDPSSRSIKIQIWLLSGKHTNIAMESHLKSLRIFNRHVP